MRSRARAEEELFHLSARRHFFSSHSKATISDIKLAEAFYLDHREHHHHQIFLVVEVFK